MTKPILVSVIVPTYNSASTLYACLDSVVKQAYPNIELIVVDNHSTDNTAEIARSFTDKVFIKGPERSAQRNYGVINASGQYVCIVDSDMQLSPEVISQCVSVVMNRPNTGGVIIPEQSFGEGFWAQCKQLERSFYVGVDWMEAARFFDTTIYKKLRGYDSKLVSGEDWDLSQRAAAVSPLGRIDALIHHNEGKLKLARTLGKKYYYAKLIGRYLAKQDHVQHASKQTNVMGRYMLFLGRPTQLFRKPHIGIGMLLMKTLEFGAGAMGMFAAKLGRNGAANG